MKSIRKLFLPVCIAVLAIGGCVRQEDLDSWKGQPVAALDLHPLFLTMPVEIQRTADGTEIRNYVNGGEVGRCFGGATANSMGGMSVMVTGNSFCSTAFVACNNIFYIKGGKVLDYVPTPTRGARCMTDSRVQPRKIGA